MSSELAARYTHHPKGEATAIPVGPARSQSLVIAHLTAGSCCTPPARSHTSQGTRSHRRSSTVRPCPAGCSATRWADVTTRVNRNGHPPAIRMTHEAVTAGDPTDDESRWSEAGGGYPRFQLYADRRSDAQRYFGLQADLCVAGYRWRLIPGVRGSSRRAGIARCR